MKQDSPSSKWLRLEDPEAARILSDPQGRRFLEPFIAQERSVGEVATELGVDMSSVLYRVRQFLRLNLIRETRLEPRRGRPIKYYRSVAEGFYVPFSATPYTSAESLSPLTFGDLQRTLNKSIGQAWLSAAGEQQSLGIHVYRNEQGISQNIVPDPKEDRPQGFFEHLLEPNAPAVWDTWGTRRLSLEAAKALQQELATVFKRYPRSAEENDGRQYIIRLAMAPLKE